MLATARPFASKSPADGVHFFQTNCSHSSAGNGVHLFPYTHSLTLFLARSTSPSICSPTRSCQTPSRVSSCTAATKPDQPTRAVSPHPPPRGRSSPWTNAGCHKRRPARSRRAGITATMTSSNISRLAWSTSAQARSTRTSTIWSVPRAAPWERPGGCRLAPQCACGLDGLAPRTLSRHGRR